MNSKEIVKSQLAPPFLVPVEFKQGEDLDIDEAHEIKKWLKNATNGKVLYNPLFKMFVISDWLSWEEQEILDYDLPAHWVEKYFNIGLIRSFARKRN